MGFNPFNSNQPQPPVTKSFTNSNLYNNNFNNSNSLGGRRQITEIKKEMLDITKPGLRKSYISKYHSEDNDNSDLPVSDNQDSTTIQRNKIENMRNLNRGL